MFKRKGEEFDKRAASFLMINLGDARLVYHNPGYSKWAPRNEDIIFIRQKGPLKTEPELWWSGFNSDVLLQMIHYALDVPWC